MNPRITKKEANLIRGAIRRAFVRSEVRKTVLKRIKIVHFDEVRPRVKNWSLCPNCNKITPTYRIVVDHKEPVVPLNIDSHSMSWDEYIDRMWCDESNLNPICEDCHTIKTEKEKQIRKEFRQERKVPKVKIKKVKNK